MGSAVSRLWAPRSHRGEGGTSSLPRGGWRAGAPRARRPERGVGGRREGGSRRGSPPACPWGWPVAPGPAPFRRRRTLSGYICSAGVARQPQAPGAVDASAWRGQGSCRCAVPPGAHPGSPAGRGAGRSLCRGLFSAFSGQAQSPVASSVPHPPCCISWCFRSAAAHAAPLSAGAELPFGSGHCGSEWAANSGHSARGRACRGCGAPPPGCRAPLRGGAGPPLPGRPPAVRGPGGGRGGGGGGGGGRVPHSPPLVPVRRPPAVAGGRPGGSGPGGPLALLAAATWCRLARGGSWRAAECWGRRFGSAVSGSRAVGQWASLLVAPAPSPTGGAARPSAAPYGWGAGGRAPGREARPCWGGRPAAMSPPQPLIAWARGARPSPASPLTRVLGLRRRRVPPAVAPVGERVVQGPGEPVVGICICDAEHRPPFQESRPGRLPAQRTLSWSSGAARPPGDTSQFPQSLQRSTAAKGWFLMPLVVPEQAQLSHLYTSTSRGRASPPRGSGTASQSRSQGRAPSAPRAGPPCGPCACGAGAAPRRPAARAAAICAGSALGAGGPGCCSGWGGMRSPASALML